MRLVFRNCMQYNEEGSEICTNAERLLNEFEDMYSEYVVNTARKKFDDIIAKLPERIADINMSLPVKLVIPISFIS